MSFVSTGGVSKLSQLSIDADKDWAGKGISDLKQLALGMIQGDLIVKGAGGILVRLPASVANLVLTSNGPGVVPTWQPGGLYLNRYYPENIYQSHALTKPTVAETYSKNAPLATTKYLAYDDEPALYIKQVNTGTNFSSSLNTVKPSVAKTYSKNAPLIKAYDLQIIVGGADKAPGGVDTDETPAAQNATANDMTLPPQTPGITDAYRFGFTAPFDQILLNVGTNGAGVWTITWQYWNGAAWTNLAGVVDGTNGFTAGTGLKTISFTRPGDWALKTINALNLYWVSATVTAYTSRSTAPKGTQSWLIKNS